MASIHDRKNSKGQKVFDVFYNIPSGEQWSRTCPDKMTANVKSKEVDAKLAKVKHGQLTPPINLNKKQLGEWLWDGSLPDEQPTTTTSLPTLGQLIKGYLESSFFLDKAQHTKRGKKLKTKHLLRLLGSKTLLQTLDEKTFQKYIDTRRTEDGKKGKVVGKTVKKELDVLRAIWNGYGLQQDLVFREWRSTFKKKLNFGKMSAKADPKSLGECTDNFESVYLEDHEVEEFLAHCKERQKKVVDIYKWGYPAICYVAYTSFRRSTMITQEVNMVNFAKNELTGWVGKEDDTMDKTPRKVPMMPTLPEILQEWLDKGHVGGKYLFCCYKNVMITDSQAWHCWKRYVAGTQWGKMEGQWHILRHSFVSIAHARGFTKDDVRVFTGHHSEAVERIYKHSTTASVAERMKGMFATGRTA